MDVNGLARECLNSNLTIWKIRDELFLELCRQSHSIHEVAKAMGVSFRTADTYRQKAVLSGKWEWDNMLTEGAK